MVTVGTWNLENLYLPGGRFGPATTEGYRRKLDRLASTITDLDVDVLAVQEVGDPQALGELVDLLPGRWHRVLSAHPDGRGIRVGFVSRFAFTDTADIAAFPPPLRPIQTGDSDSADDSATRMGRGALRVRVDTDLGGLDLLTAHLKSKLLTFPGDRFTPRDEDERARVGAYALYRRAAEAATLRIAATALLTPATPPAEASVIVLGDFNDTEQSATTQMLYGPPGSQYDTPGFDRPDRGDTTRLWTIAPKIPAGKRYSRIFEGQRELIDHILISHRLLDHLSSADTGTAGGTAPASISTDPSRRREAPASDHAPVIARFTP